MQCPECGFDRSVLVGARIVCEFCLARWTREDSRRVALRAHLDRPPRWRETRCDCPQRLAWVDWWTDDLDYLGTTSARTGPDPVNAQQPCTCTNCRGNGPVASKVATGTTNGVETGRTTENSEDAL